MPNVSIIMPVYNKEKYLDESISSVLNQKYQDFELIVVNDGSTDCSLEIIEKYIALDERIKVYSIPNGGVSNARNVGLGKASGNWIQFLDGDDLLDEDYLLCAVPVAEEKDVNILFSDFKMINTKHECVKDVLCSYHGCSDGIVLGNLFIEYQYKNGFFGFISNKLIRKELIVKSKAQFKKDLKLAEDLDFFVQVYPYVSKAYFMQVNSFYYLQTESNYMNHVIDYYSQLLIQQCIKNWFVEIGLYAAYQSTLDKRIADYVFYVLFCSKNCLHVLKENYDKVLENEPAIQCIHLVDIVGFEKLVLAAVKKRSYWLVFMLLFVRIHISKLVRSVRKNASIFV